MDGKPQRSSQQGSEYYREGEAERPARPMGPPTDADSLLEHVVQQTEWSRDDLARFAAGEKRALVEAARQLEAEQADAATVARVLTRTLVGMRFSQMAGDPVRLDQIADQVAADLLDSPVAAERLVRLWKLLLQVDSP